MIGQALKSHKLSNIERIRLLEAHKEKGSSTRKKKPSASDAMKMLFPKKDQASQIRENSNGVDQQTSHFLKYHLAPSASKKKQNNSNQVPLNRNFEEIKPKLGGKPEISKNLKVMGRKDSAPTIQSGTGFQKHKSMVKGSSKGDLSYSEANQKLGHPRTSSTQAKQGEKPLRQSQKLETKGELQAVQNFKKNLSKIFIEKRSSMSNIPTDQNASSGNLTQSGKSTVKLNLSSINPSNVKINNYFTPSIYSKKPGVPVYLNTSSNLQKPNGGLSENLQGLDGSLKMGARIYFHINPKKTGRETTSKGSFKNSLEIEGDEIDNTSHFKECNLGLMHELRRIPSGSGEAPKKKALNKSMIAFGDFIDEKRRRMSSVQVNQIKKNHLTSQKDSGKSKEKTHTSEKGGSSKKTEENDSATLAKEKMCSGKLGKKGHQRARSLEMRNDVMIVPPERQEIAMMALEKEQPDAGRKSCKSPEESKQMDSGNIHTKSYKSIKMSTAVSSTSTTQANAFTLLTRSTSSNGTKQTVIKGMNPAECQVKTIQGRKEQCRLSNFIDEVHKASKRYPQTTIDFYDVSKSLGKGSFGEVSLATQKLTGLQVAIKVFDKSQLKTDYKKQKIVQEVNIMKKITHVNTIRLLEVFEDMNCVYLVMELAEKGDLLHIMKKQNNRIPEFQAQKYFKQILDAVGWLHSQGILHRDLKLDNILIGQKNQIKLCDFGISKIMPENGEMVKEKCGTPAYNSPEIIINQGYTGFQSDVWSLGVLLYAMCSARVPFFADTVEELYKIVLQGDYEMPKEFSNSLADLISKMLVLDPRSRITLEEVKRHPWVSTGYIPEPLKQQETAKNQTNLVEVKEHLVKTVESFGFSKSYIEKSVANCVLNHAFSCYYALYKAENP